MVRDKAREGPVFWSLRATDKIGGFVVGIVEIHWSFLTVLQSDTVIKGFLPSGCYVENTGQQPMAEARRVKRQDDSVLEQSNNGGGGETRFGQI